MTRVLTAVLVAALLLTGCATLDRIEMLEHFTSADLRAAAAEGLQARAIGKLASTDRWPECFAVLADKVDAIALRQADMHGAAVAIMRVHISKASGAQPIHAECAQVVLDLERDALRLSAAGVPGGPQLLQGLKLLAH